ncbi:unnamed protein product [Tenebrio molitor]|nr:unnamed protein product [Tenebrio molitor]
MLASFSIPKWYTWNIKNRKLLLTILTNTTRPISLKFTDSFIINYTLFSFIGKTLYSIVSVFLISKLKNANSLVYLIRLVLAYIIITLYK